MSLIQSVRVDLGFGSNTPANYFDANTTSETYINMLNFETQAATGWTFSMAASNAFGEVGRNTAVSTDPAVTPVNGYVFDSWRDSWRLENIGGGQAAAQIILGGLDNTKVYDIIIISAKDLSNANFSGTFSIGATQVTHDAAATNLTQVEFSSIKPTNTQVVIEMLTNGTLPNDSMYVNMIDIRESFGTDVVADFTISPQTGATGDVFTFTDTSSIVPPVVSWNWNFGIDATPLTAIGQGPHQVTYSSDGIKAPQLTATANEPQNFDTIVKSLKIGFGVGPVPGSAIIPFDVDRRITRPAELRQFTFKGPASAYNFNWTFRVFDQKTVSYVETINSTLRNPAPTFNHLGDVEVTVSFDVDPINVGTAGTAGLNVTRTYQQQCFLKVFPDLQVPRGLGTVVVRDVTQAADRVIDGSILPGSIVKFVGTYAANSPTGNVVDIRNIGNANEEPILLDFSNCILQDGGSCITARDVNNLYFDGIGDFTGDVVNGYTKCKLSHMRTHGINLRGNYSNIIIAGFNIFNSGFSGIRPEAINSDNIANRGPNTHYNIQTDYNYIHDITGSPRWGGEGGEALYYGNFRVYNPPDTDQLGNPIPGTDSYAEPYDGYFIRWNIIEDIGRDAIQTTLSTGRGFIIQNNQCNRIGLGDLGGQVSAFSINDGGLGVIENNFGSVVNGPLATIGSCNKIVTRNNYFTRIQRTKNNDAFYIIIDDSNDSHTPVTFEVEIYNNTVIGWARDFVGGIVRQGSVEYLTRLFVANNFGGGVGAIEDSNSVKQSIQPTNTTIITNKIDAENAIDKYFFVDESIADLRIGEDSPLKDAGSDLQTNLELADYYDASGYLYSANSISHQGAFALVESANQTDVPPPQPTPTDPFPVFSVVATKEIVRAGSSTTLSISTLQDLSSASYDWSVIDEETSLAPVNGHGGVQGSPNDWTSTASSVILDFLLANHIYTVFCTITTAGTNASATTVRATHLISTIRDVTTTTTHTINLASQAASFVIADTWDGVTVNAGDVFEFVGKRNGPQTLNWESSAGTVSNPVIFKNNGLVEINADPSFNTPAIRVNGTGYFVIDGTNDSAFEYGFKFTAANTAATAIEAPVSLVDKYGGIRMFGVEITNCGSAAIRLLTKANTANRTVNKIQDIYLHHCFVHDINGEGIVFGVNELSDSDPQYFAALQNVHLYRNEIANIGLDAIQVSYVDNKTCFIVENVIQNVNLQSSTDKGAALVLNSGFSGFVENNTIINCQRFATVQQWDQAYFTGNVAAGITGKNGIVIRFTPVTQATYNARPYIWGNTFVVAATNTSSQHMLLVVDAAPDQAAAPEVKTYNNVWIGGVTSPIASGDVDSSYLIENNYAATRANIAIARFTSVDNDDYRIQQASPLINFGRDLTGLIPSVTTFYDAAGVEYPVNGDWHAGAYSISAFSVDEPIVIPPSVSGIIQYRIWSPSAQRWLTGFANTLNEINNTVDPTGGTESVQPDTLFIYEIEEAEADGTFDPTLYYTKAETDSVFYNSSQVDSLLTNKQDSLIAFTGININNINNNISVDLSNYEFNGSIDIHSFSVSNAAVTIQATDTQSNNVSLQVGINQILFSNKNPQVDADYSNDYTDRDLADWGNVKSHVAQRLPEVYPSGSFGDIQLNNGTNGFIHDPNFSYNEGLTVNDKVDITGKLTQNAEAEIASWNSNAVASYSLAHGEASHAGGRASAAFNSSDAIANYSFAANNARAEGIDSVAFNEASAAQNDSAAFGKDTTANAERSLVFGNYTLTSGLNALSGGEGRIDKLLRADGKNSVNLSANTAAQIVGHGAIADNSAIIGGQDHDIPIDALRSVILGGDAIKARSAESDQVYVPNLNINSSPIAANVNSDQFLMRDIVTGQVKFVLLADLPVSGSTAGAGNLMLKSVYDPDNVGVDVFNITNHKIPQDAVSGDILQVVEAGTSGQLQWGVDELVTEASNPVLPVSGTSAADLQLTFDGDTHYQLWNQTFSLNIKLAISGHRRGKVISLELVGNSASDLTFSNDFKIIGTGTFDNTTTNHVLMLYRGVGQKVLVTITQ